MKIFKSLLLSSTFLIGFTACKDNTAIEVGKATTMEIKPSCSCTVVAKPEKPIQPGESTIIRAEINTDELHTKNIHKAVTLMTNTEPNITVLQIKGRIK